MRAACCLAALLSLSTLAAGQRTSATGGFSASVTNLRTAGWGTTLSDDLLLYLVDEWQQGWTDFNGDDDADDYVLHARSLVTGATTNLRLAAAAPGLASERLVVLSVDEIHQGFADRNGDGDLRDGVLFVLDRATKSATNLELASLWFEVAGERVAFLVSESAQGDSDRNGDGDAFDFVLHVYQPWKGVTNLGLAVRPTPDGPSFLLEGALLAFLVDEEGQGDDRNGDGSIGDEVLHVYDFHTGELRNLALSLGQSDVDGHVWVANEGMVVFGVWEDAQGTDLNGDGDVFDLVPHVYRARLGKVRNLALSSVVISFDQGYVLGDSFAAFLVRESAEGMDLNADGDLQDQVAFVYEESTDEVRNLELGVRHQSLSQPPLWAAGGRHLAFQVSELAEHRDLNSDGDVGAEERVLHLHDVDANTTRNEGLAVVDGVLSRAQLAFRVPESAQGVLDLTGDGDASDAVLHVHDFRTGRTRSSSAAAAADYTVASDVVLFATDERIELADQNGDGDALDDTAHVFGFASGAVERLGLAIPRFGSFSLLGQLSPHRSALLAIPEDDQGFTDLNGDGDAEDWCLHLVEVREISRRR